MRNIFEKHSSGFEAENEFLGNGPKVDDLLIQKKIDPTQLSRNALKVAITENYPLDPEIPQKKWGKDLYNFVAEELGLNVEDPAGLKFYNCLGTNLDRRGVDCFFVFKNPNNNCEAWFEIDITTNNKKDVWKSDLIININNFPDYRKDKDGYISELKRYATIIAEKLLRDTETIH